MYSGCSNRINLKIKFIPPWMDMKWKTSIPFIVFIFSRANIRNLSISRLFISSNLSRMWWATLSRWTDILPLCKTSNHKLLDATNTNFIILDRHCDVNGHLNLWVFSVGKYRIPNRFLNKVVKNSITESLSRALLSKILFQLQWINSKQKISSILQGNYIQSNMFYGAFPGNMEIGSHNTESDDRLTI